MLVCENTISHTLASNSSTTWRQNNNHTEGMEEWENEILGMGPSHLSHGLVSVGLPRQQGRQLGDVPGYHGKVCPHDQECATNGRIGMASQHSIHHCTVLCVCVCVCVSLCMCALTCFFLYGILQVSHLASCLASCLVTGGRMERRARVWATCVCVCVCMRMSK